MRHVGECSNSLVVATTLTVDRCCEQSDGSEQAQAYTLLKSLDPCEKPLAPLSISSPRIVCHKPTFLTDHATIGAMDCGDLWSFSDVASYANATAPLNASVLPVAKQPATQLSLDGARRPLIGSHYISVRG